MGLFFGLIPALTASGAVLSESMKEGGRTGSAARGARTRGTFVVVEIALALVLLISAGLLVRSFAKLLAVDPGFDVNTISMGITLPASRYAGDVKPVQFYQQLFDRIDALPGVRGAGAISFLPLATIGASTSYTVVGQPPPPRGQEQDMEVRVVTRDYFKAMGVPLVRGRLFSKPEDATPRAPMAPPTSAALGAMPANPRLAGAATGTMGSRSATSATGAIGTTSAAAASAASAGASAAPTPAVASSPRPKLCDRERDARAASLAGQDPVGKRLRISWGEDVASEVVGGSATRVFAGSTRRRGRPSTGRIRRTSIAR